MTYQEVMAVVDQRPDSVSAFVPVINEDGEHGLFWGTFALCFRGEDLTEQMAADLPLHVRGMAALIALSRARLEARGQGLELMA